MSGKRLVSIVLPVYNGERYLAQAIDSCLEQTYENLEIIIVDDASTDHSVQIVRSYGDKRIKLICHNRNRKLPAALNTGFRHSSGAYLTWTSHDNYFAPNAIAAMVEVLEENPGVDFVFADDYWVDEEGQIIRVEKNGPVEHLPESSCLGGCFVYTRRVYEGVGPYSEDTFLAEDYDYWLRALAKFTFFHLEVPLHYYRQHSGSLTTRFAEGEAFEVELAARRRNLGRYPWRNRIVLHRTHLEATFRFLDWEKQSAAARALLWAIAFNPISVMKYPVIIAFLKMCLSQDAFRRLLRLKHALFSAEADGS
jgi:glycosyltransferase involved in cell wall biosynthesis